MNKLAQYGLTAAVGACILSGVALGYNSFSNWRQRGIAEVKENSRLAGECMMVASGENNLLDSQDGVALARDIGYTGVIFPGEKILLFQEPMIGENPRLLIGYEPNPGFGKSICRQSMEIAPQKMKNYLKNHSKN